MALGTLGELRDAVLDTRTDLIGRFGEILALAEQRMYYGGSNVPPLRVLAMESNATLTFADGTAAHPSGFLDKRALYWEGSETVSLCYEPPSVFYPMSRGRQGSAYPFAYTIEGTNFKLSPALSGDAKLIYYAKAASMSADNDTNAILQNWPGVYLFGCQIEAYRISRNDEEMAKALRMYADAVDAANKQTMMARTFGGPLRKRVGFGV